MAVRSPSRSRSSATVRTQINDKLTFNFGLRVTEEDKNGIAFNAGYSDSTFSTITAVTADYNKTETFTSVAPKLGLDYQFNNDVMGYLTVSRGFKSGGFNVRAQATAFPESAEPFDDEVLTVAEVGIKSILADRSLILNVAAFRGDYEDVQVSTFTDFDSDGDGTNDAFFGNFLNAGSATISGLEVEFDWKSRTAHWFGLSGNLSYLDASPDDFLDANNDGFVDTQVITNAPEWTGYLALNFNFPAFGGLISSSRRLLLSRRFGAHQRGWSESDEPRTAAPADLAGVVQPGERLDLLAVGQRRLAVHDQR